MVFAEKSVAKLQPSNELLFGTFFTEFVGFQTASLESAFSNYLHETEPFELSEEE